MTGMATPANNNSSQRSRLQHQWVAAGIVYAAARFVPVPILDDVIRDQCRRFVATRTLAQRDDLTTLTDVKPYYESNSGCLTGCLGTVTKLPLKLLLFPIRKVVAIVTAVRGVPLDIIRTVLLGRTLDRQLNLGPVTPDQAAQMRIAFDQAFARMDFRTLRAAIGDALSSVKGWRSAALASGRAAAETESAGDELSTEQPVNDGARKVQSVLQLSETTKLFSEFDQRFEQALKALVGDPPA